MTEYILLVGLLAILLIAAVGNYGERVDEAIQGTANMVRRTNNHMGADKTVVDPRDPDKKWDIYNFEDRRVAVPEGENPTSSSVEYDPDVHGR